MDYKLKYKKYKSKYVNLKNDFEGGSSHNDDFNKKFQNGEIQILSDLEEFLKDPCIILGFFDVCSTCKHLGNLKNNYIKILHIF